jgi:hypothetical protein
VVLSGPGLSANDEVLVGLRLFEDALNNRYSINLAGCTGVIGSSNTYNGHVNSTPDPKRIFLINQPMQYWFVANGRRFMAVVKVSTVFESAYAGFMLPYSLPNLYTYPMFIGGCAGSGGSGAALDWTNNTQAHRFFAAGAYDTLTGNYETPSMLLDPMGQWLRVTGSRQGNVQGQVGVLPYEGFDGFNSVREAAAATNPNNYPYFSMLSRVTRDFDANGYSLMPLTLVQQTPADQTFGILDGVYFAPGRFQTAENIIDINGVDHLVIPNVFRSGFTDFIAMELN